VKLLLAPSHRLHGLVLRSDYVRDIQSVPSDSRIANYTESEDGRLQRDAVHTGRHLPHFKGSC
jgi:hypothetical protein